MILKNNLEQSKKNGIEESNFNKSISFYLIPVHILLHNICNTKACFFTLINLIQVDQLLSYITKADILDLIIFKLAKKFKKSLLNIPYRKKKIQIQLQVFREIKKITIRKRYKKKLLNIRYL